MAYIPKRTPAAHQVAASANTKFKGCFLYVEGASDCCFWNNYIDRTKVKLVACDGWPKVIATVQENTKYGNTCIGIIDRDFRDYANYGDVPDNVFLWDCHDLEMTIYKKGSYERAINSFDISGKYLDAKDNGHDLLGEAMIASNKVEYLKLAEKLNTFGLKFKHKHKDEIECPDYSKIFDRTFALLDDKKIVEYLISWSTSKGYRPNVEVNVIKSAFDTEQVKELDSFLLSNGHDLSHILAYLLWKKLKATSRAIPADEFENKLYIAFQDTELFASDLYNNIKNYCKPRNIELFKNELLQIMN